MKVDPEHIHSEVRRRQAKSLAANVPYVVLDAEKGAYIERQPDGSEILLQWCSDYRGTVLQRLARLVRQRLQRPAAGGNLEKLYRKSVGV